MSTINLILNDIETLDTLNESIKSIKQEINDKIEKLTIEDYKQMSFEDLFTIYCNIKYYKAFENKKDEVIKLLISKRNAKYPEYEGATNYPELNDLDMDKAEIHQLDSILGQTRVGNFMLKGASLYRPISKYFELLSNIGICEEVYVLSTKDYDDSYEDYYETTQIISKEDYIKYLRCWELKDKVMKDNNDTLQEEFNSLCENGYDYIYIGEEEIEDKEDFDKHLSEIRYKLIKERNTSFDKYILP